MELQNGHAEGRHNLGAELNVGEMGLTGSDHQKQRLQNIVEKEGRRWRHKALKTMPSRELTADAQTSPQGRRNISFCLDHLGLRQCRFWEAPGHGKLFKLGRLRPPVS